jgi:hypothetical protein
LLDQFEQRPGPPQNLTSLAASRRVLLSPPLGLLSLSLHKSRQADDLEAQHQCAESHHCDLNHG